ncbi:acyltransferase [Fervidibacillus albus]|uniref:Acyltransferase n=1 Tax=Fervidibacillus albus TaxID=2980026 RepID=A0A9E8LT18_9BACI|nr:acyltransferase [Fervidibacillus albus]WAA09079.1 acyltransferase [Fervidibacillus albus]
MKKRSQINEVYVVRAIAILGVLAVHSTSSVVTELGHDSKFWIFYNFVNIFMKFGTPTFIMLSSFVLFYNYSNRKIDQQLLRRFYKNRLLYILIPYLIFSIFYYSLTVFLYYDYSLQEFFNKFTIKLLTGKAYTHLYFVFISIQFYILFPILLWVFQKWKWISKNAIWIGLVIQWAFVLYNHYILNFPLTGSISLSYMSYYFLGGFLGIYYDKVKDWLIFNNRRILSISIWIVWLIAGFSHVYLWYWTRTTGLYTDAKLYTFLWNIHTLASSIVLMQMAYWIYAKWSPKIVNILIQLGIVSFGVYLIHPFILLVYRNGINVSTSVLYHLYVIGGFLAVLIISWIVVRFSMEKNKWSWIFFGAIPKKIPVKEEER